MLIDSHAHLNFAAFTKDADDVIQHSLDNDIWVINVGSQLSASGRAVELARKYPQGVYASVGLHPIHISDQEIEGDEEYIKEKYNIKDSDLVVGEIKKLAREDKVVAIGEIGLDYFHIPKRSDIEKLKNWQKEYFKKFINLTVELDKPLILHCRGDKNDPTRAYEEMLEILTAQFTAADGETFLFPTKRARGVIHCFGANLEIAKRFVDLGFLIGFTGIITFKNVKELQEAAKNIDLKNILIETDSPYLTPEPFRGERNEPMYVKYIAEKIAGLKGINFEKVAAMTTGNAKKLFEI